MAAAPSFGLGSGGCGGLGHLLWVWPLLPELSTGSISRRLLLGDDEEKRRWRLRRGSEASAVSASGGLLRGGLGKSPLLLVPQRPPAAGQLSSRKRSSEVKSLGFGETVWA